MEMRVHIFHTKKYFLYFFKSMKPLQFLPLQDQDRRR